MMEIRSWLARSARLKALYHGYQRLSASTVCRVSPRLLNRIRYRRGWRQWPDLQDPKTFDEKLIWLNLNWRDPAKAKCGDKYGMRSHVTARGMAHLLPVIHAVFEDTRQIDPSCLPKRFVLKCSHGCKCNVFCRDRSVWDWDSARRDLDSWMRMDFSLLAGELHYGEMAPRIICEEFLDDGQGDGLPVDYKVFCFDGKAFCTMVATERDANGNAKLAFYDLSWSRKLPYCIPELAAKCEVAAPNAYGEMLEAAIILSSGFPFVRMDFYNIGGRAKLGEMTFTPGGCVSANYMTRTAQLELGGMIRLPKVTIWNGVRDIKGGAERAWTVRAGG